jgi:hypothetical protein
VDAAPLVGREGAAPKRCPPRAGPTGTVRFCAVARDRTRGERASKGSVGSPGGAGTAASGRRAPAVGDRARVSDARRLHPRATRPRGRTSRLAPPGSPRLVRSGRRAPAAPRRVSARTFGPPSSETTGRRAGGGKGGTPSSARTGATRIGARVSTRSRANRRERRASVLGADPIVARGRHSGEPPARAGPSHSSDSAPWPTIVRAGQARVACGGRFAVRQGHRGLGPPRDRYRRPNKRSVARVELPERPTPRPRSPRWAPPKSLRGSPPPASGARCPSKPQCSRPRPADVRTTGRAPTPTVAWARGASRTDPPAPSRTSTARGHSASVLPGAGAEQRRGGSGATARVRTRRRVEAPVPPRRRRPHRVGAARRPHTRRGSGPAPQATRQAPPPTRSKRSAKRFGARGFRQFTSLYHVFRPRPRMPQNARTAADVGRGRLRPRCAVFGAAHVPRVLAGQARVFAGAGHAGQFCGVCGRFDGADGPDDGPSGPSCECLPPLRGTRTCYTVRGGERRFGRPACRCVGPSAGRTALRRVQGGGPRRPCGRAPLERACPPRRCRGRPAASPRAGLLHVGVRAVRPASRVDRRERRGFVADFS